MTIGAVIQTIGHNHAMLWVGRVIAGIGNGQHTSTVGRRTDPDPHVAI